MESQIHKPPLAVFFVGDVFDLWIANFDYFKHEYGELLKSLKKLSEHNVRMVYFQGNHDLYLEDFWVNEMGWEVYRSPQTFDLCGTRFLIEHGDLMNPDDRGYLFLKATLNHKWIEKAIKRLPDRVVKAVGQKMSRASRKKSAQPDESEVRSMIRSHAMMRHKESGARYIVTGHVHLRDEWWEPDERFCSINLGTWLETPKIWSWSPDQSQWLSLAGTN